MGVMALMAFTPGPANIFAIATGARGGRVAALQAVVGMNCATLTWFGAAALGLGALALSFPDAFHLLTYAGAGYLVWLAFSALREGNEQEPANPDAPAGASRGRALWQGFAVQIANPKAILFFTAVLPPFLDPARPVAPQLALFACGTIGLDLISMSTYGLSGSALAKRMAQPRFRRGFSIATAMMLLLAATLILLKD